MAPPPPPDESSPPPPPVAACSSAMSCVAFRPASVGTSCPTAVVPGPAAGESFGAHWLEPRVSTIAGAASVAAAARHVKRAAWSMRIRSVLRASARPGGGRGAAAVPARCADLFLGSKHAIFLIIFLVSTQGGRQHNGSVTRDHTDSHPTLTPLTTWRHTWRSTR